MEIAVVGAGFGGLAAAALLARKGHSVTVYEAACRVGGRSVAVEHGGFKAELGPTWYLMDDVYDAFFAELGVSRPYQLVDLDPAFEFRDEAHGRAVVRPGAVADVLEELEDGAGERFEELMEEAGRLYRAVSSSLLFRRYEGPLDFLRAGLPMGPRALRYFAPFGGLVESRFRSPLVRRLLEYDGLFVGSPPWELPALYGLLLNYAVFVRGPKAPRGGFSAVASSIAQLASKFGAEFRLCRRVAKIAVEGGRAVGVVPEGGSLERYDAVVVNADYPAGEELLPPSYRLGEGYWGRRKVAPSAYMAVLAVEGRWEGPPHVVHIASWEEHMRALVGLGGMPPNPSFYVHLPTVTEPDWAPPGMSTAFLLVPAPPAAGYGPPGLAEKLFRRSFGAAARTLAEYPTDFFCRAFGAYRCTALGLRHTLGQTGPGRAPMRHRRVRNLYFVGQYVHPGVGVPMVLASAVVLARHYV